MRAVPLARPLALALSLAAFGCLERGGEQSRPPPTPVDPPAATAPATHRPPSGEPDPDAEISVRLEAEPSHLNALIAGDGLAIRVTLGDVYQGLLCRPRPLAPPRPCLAHRFVRSPDEREWRFWLRDDVVFHDGSRLGPADVLASIKAVASGRAPTPLTAELDDLLTAVVEGETIVVRFSGRRLDRLGTFARLPILPAAQLSPSALPTLVAEPISRAPVGTGPLRVTGWRAGESITLERWADYWGEPARARRIVYRIVGSRERAYAMARTGKLDVAAQLPVTDARDIAATREDLDLYTYRSPAYLAAVYNTRRPALDSAAERRGLTMLLDRRSIISAILAGEGEPISGPYIGAEVDPAVEAPPFDRPKAKAALADADQPIAVLYPSESRTMARIADIWAADARGVVSLSPTPAPFATVLERARSGDFDVVLLAFTTGAELDMWPRLHSSQIGGENYGALRDDALDRALVEVRSASSPEARIAASRRAHRLIDELAPYAFIASDVRAGLVGRGIGGIGEGDGLAARFLWRAMRSAP